MKSSELQEYNQKKYCNYLSVRGEIGAMGGLRSVICFRQNATNLPDRQSRRQLL